MTSISSIFGVWTTSICDTLPPVQQLNSDIPITCNLVNEAGSMEELVIRQTELTEHNIDEIQLTYRANNKTTINKCYQLGKWNIEKYLSNSVVGATVFAAKTPDDDEVTPSGCRSFVVLRYGPSTSVSRSAQSYT